MSRCDRMGTLITGKVGAEVNLEFGKNAARQAVLTILATLRAQQRNLNRFQAMIKLLEMVYTSPNFQEHPQVINGCRELFVGKP